MNKDEAIGKIKEQLKKLMAFSAEAEVSATENVECESVKLKDGSEIMIPTGANIEPGVEVYLIDAEGNQTPCEDGSYELEDGKTITCKSGLIEGVVETAQPEGEQAQTESPVAPAEMAAPDAEAAAEGEAPAVEAGEKIGERVAALEQQIAQILELLQGMSNAQEMAMSKINEIAEAPATPSIKVGKSVGSSTAKVEFSSTKDELDELRNLKNKFKINGNGGYAFNAATTK